MLQGVSIEIVNVTKKYGAQTVIAGISAAVQPGECLAVTGKNGSGKSTLLKIIAGLVRPSTGHVRMLINGEELASEERMQCMGMVSPEVVFYNVMTGFENVAFLVRARARELNEEKINQCFEFIGLDKQKHSLVSGYSTGMRQRLKLATIMAVHPHVWLLDEPSSNLDADGKHLVAEVVHQALHSNATVILATNESWEAEYGRHQIALV
jgi:ABC-type multidrug transport system ATPase subunit